jgi:hypothetical protein
MTDEELQRLKDDLFLLTGKTVEEFTADARQWAQDAEEIGPGVWGVRSREEGEER